MFLVFCRWVFCKDKDEAKDLNGREVAAWKATGLIREEWERDFFRDFTDLFRCPAERALWRWVSDPEYGWMLDTSNSDWIRRVGMDKAEDRHDGSGPLCAGPTFLRQFKEFSDMLDDVVGDLPGYGG